MDVRLSMLSISLNEIPNNSKLGTCDANRGEGEKTGRRAAFPSRNNRSRISPGDSSLSHGLRVAMLQAMSDSAH